MHDFTIAAALHFFHLLSQFPCCILTAMKKMAAPVDRRNVEAQVQGEKIFIVFL